MADAFEISDTTGQLQELVSRTELTGKPVHFLRNGNPVVVLISHDEHLALRETIALAADERLRNELAAAEQETKSGDLYLAEELGGE